jgi:hypothetical protein
MGRPGADSARKTSDIARPALNNGAAIPVSELQHGKQPTFFTSLSVKLLYGL